MVILITGAKGQLGSELKKIIMSGKSELGKLPIAYAESQVLDVDVEELDITSSYSVDSFFRQYKPNLVFNCAAMTNVDGCESDEETAYRVNSIGPKNLAVASQIVNSRLIHVSTDYVFKGDVKNPYNENDIPNPNTAYGRTKLKGEKSVQEACQNSCICRTAWLYGYKGNNFVKTMLRLARENGSLKVVNDQFGNPTNAVDLAYQMILLGASNETGVFHCTCGGIPVSWHTFATRIVSNAGLEVPVYGCTTSEFPRIAQRPAFSALENRRLKTTIGDSMRNWEEAIDSFIKNYLKQEMNE